MSYDTRCFDLAMVFINDEFPALPNAVKQRVGDSLAQQIQYTIEEELEQRHKELDSRIRNEIKSS